MPAPDSMLAFGEFHADLERRLLLRDGHDVHLAPRSWSLLELLLANQGSVVPKREVLDRIWPAAGASEYAMSRTVRRLREALGDDTRRPRYFRTVHGRGFEWIAPVTPARAVEPVAERSAPFVGRSAVLVSLGTAFAEAVRGRRRAVFVEGELGAGKSTVVDRFLSGPATSAGLALGHCIESRGSAEPYRPVLEAIDHAAAQDRRVVDVLRRCAPTWLAQVPWLDEPGDRAGHLAALEVTTRPWMLRELVRLVDELTASEPLVLVLEDLHWADGGTLDALELVVRRRDPAHLLVLATYRPTEAALANRALGRLVAGLVAGDLATRIVLPPLDLADVRSLAEARLGTGRLGEGDLARLASWTAGNPLFVRTALDDLSDAVAGAGSEDAVQVEVARLAGGAVPATLEELIAGQVERLDTHDLALLEAAAVVGGSLGAGLLSAVVDAERDEVEDDLEWLTSSTVFLSQAEPLHGDPRYELGHVAYRHVLARRVGRSRATAMHLRAADWLEQAPAPERRHPLELAEHLLAAGEPGRAVPHLLSAAWESRRRFDDRAALTLFDRALGAYQVAGRPDVGREIEARTGLAVSQLSLRTSQDDETVRNIDRLEALVAALGPHPAAFVAWQNLLLVDNLAGRTGQVQRLAPVLLELAVARGRDREVMDAHHSMGEAELHAGRPAEALRHFDHAWAIAQRLELAQGPGRSGTRWLLDSGARIAAAQAGAALLAGEVDRVRPAAEVALAACRRPDVTPLVRVGVSSICAATLLLQGAPAAAAGAAELSLELAEDENEDFRAVASTVRWATGTPSSLEERRGAARTLLDRPTIPYPLGLVAFLSSGLLPPDELLVVLEEAEQRIAAADTHWTAAELLRLRAALLVRTGDPAARPLATELLERAVTLAAGQGSRWYEWRAASDLADLRVGGAPQAVMPPSTTNSEPVE
jgi:DNA-binding winged helix-turn-helix (wHTH) protein